MLDLAILPPEPTPAVPRDVRRGAAFFLAYGVAVVVSAAIIQSLGGWEQWQAFPRAVLRLLGCAAIAHGLTRRVRWVWWVAVILGGSWLVLGTLGIAGLTIGLRYAGEPLPVVFLVNSSIVFALLATSMAYLLRRESRDAFRA